MPSTPARRPAARGARGDADGAGTGHHRRAVSNAANDQTGRQPQRIDRSLHAQRQAMERRADDLELAAGALSDAKTPQKAAGPPRHEATVGSESQVRRRYRRPSQGRVASPKRSRHPAAFNSDLDIAPNSDPGGVVCMDWNSRTCRYGKVAPLPGPTQFASPVRSQLWNLRKIILQCYSSSSMKPRSILLTNSLRAASCRFSVDY